MSENESTGKYSLQCGNPKCNMSGKMSDPDSPFISIPCRGCTPKKQLTIIGSFLRWFRLYMGLSSVPEICEASTDERDYHDYPKHMGGDGTPTHHYRYRCWNCGKRFTI